MRKSKLASLYPGMRWQKIPMGKGWLSKNQFKTSPKSPQLSGELETVEGEILSLGGWVDQWGNIDIRVSRNIPPQELPKPEIDYGDEREDEEA